MRSDLGGPVVREEDCWSRGQLPNPVNIAGPMRMVRGGGGTYQGQPPHIKLSNMIYTPHRTRVVG